MQKKQAGHLEHLENSQWDCRICAHTCEGVVSSVQAISCEKKSREIKIYKRIPSELFGGGRGGKAELTVHERMHSKLLKNI